MSRIQSEDTGPELAVRRALTRAGVRYRLHVPSLPGRPDIVIRNARAVIFVDGCFWHGCPQHYVRPRVRQRYWDAKLARNRDRRARALCELESQGWTSLEIWECEISERLSALLSQIEHAMRGSKSRITRHRSVEI